MGRCARGRLKRSFSRNGACVGCCQSARAKIFHFTEIRFSRMCRPSRLTRRGDLEVVLIASRACGGRGSVGMRGAGRAGSPCEPETACGRAALLGFVSPVSFAAPSTGLEILRRHGGPCVRQNRVVLAVVATVKPDRRCARAQPGGRHHPIRTAREAKGKFGSRESTA